MKKILKVLLFIIIIPFGFWYTWDESRSSICMIFLNNGAEFSRYYHVIVHHAWDYQGDIKKGNTECVYYSYDKEKDSNRVVYVGFSGENWVEVYGGKSAKIVVHNNGDLASYEEYNKKSYPYWIAYGAVVFAYFCFCWWCKKRAKK